jgi:superfamily II DNA or RNA helicase
MNLREYQKQAVDFLIYNYRGMVHAPAGSGKTVMMAAAADRLIDEAIGIDRIVVMANTVEQCQQIQAAMDTFDIGSRTSLQIGCAASKLDTINADLLIVDECHHAPAPTWADQIELSTQWRWGFTATPFDRDEDRNKALREMFGPVFEIKRDRLVEDGHLTKAQVRWLDAYDEDVCARIIEHKNDLFEQRKRRYPFLFYGDGAVEQERKCHWQSAAKIGLCENHKRTQAIIDTALREGDKSVLILVSKIEYGKDLRDQLLYSELCHSKMGKAKRRRVIELFKSGELPILIATTLADEGLDVPCAEVLIIANAGRSATKLEQRTGRVLRPYAGKERGIIYDFRDTFDPMLRAQAYKRRAIYTKLKYQQ